MLGKIPLNWITPWILEHIHSSQMKPLYTANQDNNFSDKEDSSKKCQSNAKQKNLKDIWIDSTKSSFFILF